MEKANNQSLAGTNKTNGEENTEHTESQTTETHEKEYECEICSKMFKRLNNMKKHDIKFHMKKGSRNENPINVTNATIFSRTSKKYLLTSLVTT